MNVDQSRPADVLRDAQSIIYREKWRLREVHAAQLLAATRSLAWTRVFPESPAIHLVAVDGEIIGRIRSDGTTWTAVGLGELGTIAVCDRADDALLALVCTVGHQ